MMNDDDFVMTCSKCAHQIQRKDFKRSDGNIDKYNCSSCGSEEWVEVLKTVFPHDFSEEDETSKQTIFVVWSSNKPSVGEIKALRDLFPKYKEKSLSSLLKSLPEIEFKIGEFFEWEVDEIKKQSEILPISIRCPSQKLETD